MRKIMLALGSSFVFVAPMASADIVGAGASVSYWDSEMSGDVVARDSAVDVENDLDLSADSNVNLTAHIEHFVPLLPNLLINYTVVEQSGRGELSPAGFDSLSGDVRSEFDLDQFDLTLYYEILDNWVNLDLGLTARDLSAELIVTEQTGTLNVSQTKISGTIPMGYVAARFDLPFTGVSVGAEGNVISFDGDSIHDVNAYGQYEIAVLQLRGGYRQMAVDYEDSDDKLDVDISGPYVSVGVNF